MTSPQTGMYGFVGFFDSPRPWSMMCDSCATVSALPTVVSAGTSGETPPRPRSPWHWTHANWTNVCAPAAIVGSTEAVAEDGVCPAAGAAATVTVVTREP